MFHCGFRPAKQDNKTALLFTVFMNEYIYIYISPTGDACPPELPVALLLVGTR